MTADSRWTPETEETIARQIAAVDRYRADAMGYVWRAFREQATSALAAVADAGLLLPPGGDVREERRHRTAARLLSACAGPDLKCTVAAHHEARTVHTGPWRPVDVEGAQP